MYYIYVDRHVAIHINSSSIQMPSRDTAFVFAPTNDRTNTAESELLYTHLLLEGIYFRKSLLG